MRFRSDVVLDHFHQKRPVTLILKDLEAARFIEFDAPRFARKESHPVLNGVLFNQLPDEFPADATLTILGKYVEVTEVGSRTKEPTRATFDFKKGEAIAAALNCHALFRNGLQDILCRYIAGTELLSMFGDKVGNRGIARVEKVFTHEIDRPWTKSLQLVVVH